MARNIKLDGRAIRLLCMLLTRPDEKRTLRESKTAQDIDAKLREINLPYDEDLEVIALKVNRLRSEFRADDPEFQQAISRLNQEASSLDSIAEDNIKEFVLEERDYDHVNNILRELRGVPSDRMNGPVYVRLHEAFEKAPKVDIRKVDSAS